MNNKKFSNWFSIVWQRTAQFFQINRRQWLIGLPIFSVVITLFSLLFLPDIIPIHYDSSWKIDRYGSKFELLLIPGVTILLSLFFGALWKNRENTYPADIKIALSLVILNLVQFFILILAWHHSFV